MLNHTDLEQVYLHIALIHRALPSKYLIFLRIFIVPKHRSCFVANEDKDIKNHLPSFATKYSIYKAFFLILLSR
jgi:hypothetical protein